MKIFPTKRYAVLTGDIVNSSKLTKVDRKLLPGVIKRAARETKKAFPDAVPLEIEVFRGDSWQMLVLDPVLSLRIGLYFRACLRSGQERGRGLDTRTAIALGAIDFVPKGKVSEGDGEAYRASGQALESLPAGRFLAVTGAAFPQPNPLDAITVLMDALIQDWTGKQARAVAGALRGWTQERIAKAWPESISQQAITKHLGGAHWPAFETAVAFSEQYLEKNYK